MTGALLQALISGLATGGIYALVALAFSITFTTTKTLNFGHGEFVSAGAFVGVSAMLMLLGKPMSGSLTGEPVGGWLQVIAIVVATFGIGLLGLLLYVLAVRPFAGKPGMSWVMTTLGFGIILQSIGLAVWGPGTVMVPPPFGDDVIRVFGIGIRSQEILILVVSLLIMAVFDFIMQRTMVGKAMRAVAHNRQVASLMGINVTAVMLGAFFISSAACGPQRHPDRSDRFGIALPGPWRRAQGLLRRDHRGPLQPTRLRAGRVRSGCPGINDQPLAGPVA